jgi:hypothetical protein
VITACSRLETGLTRICKILDGISATPTETKWEKIKERGIKRVGKFLRDNISIHLEDHSAWQRILDYYHVRHCITHAQGALRSGAVETRAAIKDAAGDSKSEANRCYREPLWGADSRL